MTKKLDGLSVKADPTYRAAETLEKEAYEDGYHEYQIGRGFNEDWSAAKQSGWRTAHLRRMEAQYG